MKKNKKPPRMRRILICAVFLLILCAASGALIYAGVTARVVHVRRVTAVIPDLPDPFDGKTILFVSDIDMVGLNGPGSAASLMRSLAKLKPDILILGGDYASPSLSEAVNSSADPLRREELRRKFFASLADFEAPMGKFAVAGENDIGDDLAAEMRLGGVELLSDRAATIQLGGRTVSIVGLSDYSLGKTNYSAVASTFSGGDCVIAVAHNPSAISAMLTAEAKNSGAWCDMILSGHTHSGQMVIGGRPLFRLSQQETRYPAGWSKESGVRILVSSGAGCETVNLRLGTQAEVHLITLTNAPALGE